MSRYVPSTLNTPPATIMVIDIFFAYFEVEGSGQTPPATEYEAPIENKDDSYSPEISPRLVFGCTTNHPELRQFFGSPVDVHDHAQLKDSVGIDNLTDLDVLFRDNRWHRDDNNQLPSLARAPSPSCPGPPQRESIGW
ncbi:hypothetical protein PQX77_014424 [Marasmius sp. AFHP31]|nr:hypothetical protein PQX77_014424 [Marasmius sp. AFHP31]